MAMVEEIDGRSSLVVHEKTDGWHSDSRIPEVGTPPPSILYINNNQIEDVTVEHQDQDLLQQTSSVSTPTFTASDLLGTPLLVTALALGDLNGDGHSDIIRANYKHPVQIVFNDGVGNFTISSSLPRYSHSSECIALGDINGDGFTNIVVGAAY